MTAKKIISVLPASAKSARQFVCPAETDRSEDVTLLFQDDLATQKLEVVRLSLEGLPATYNGKPIIWLTNFGIKKQGSDEYVDVAYTVLVTPRPGCQVVYFDGKEVKPAPVGGKALADFPGKIAFDLRIGDPGVGIGGNT